jgi:hypothetical protein
MDVILIEDGNMRLSHPYETLEYSCRFCPRRTVSCPLTSASFDRTNFAKFCPEDAAYLWRVHTWSQELALCTNIHNLH